MHRLQPHAAVALGLALGLAPLGAAYAQAQSARAALAQAQAAAAAWQKDAALTNVTTQEADAKGAAARWTYLFYSPKAKQAYAVEVGGGKIADQHPVRPHLTDPIGEFVDSDKAMQAAQAGGLKAKMPTPMALMVMGQSTAKPGAYWSIGTGYTPGEVSVLIEAKSGKLFRKTEIK